LAAQNCQLNREPVNPIRKGLIRLSLPLTNDVVSLRFTPFSSAPHSALNNARIVPEQIISLLTQLIPMAKKKAAAKTVPAAAGDSKKNGKPA